ncbi:MAG: CarD family transcriptional regulator [Bacteroidales bacterium]|nr:CarD family transcriptional regulator [Clostridium sp.]MCM1204431.1 CarD family transcriptional regulator [Bacteroidales bacterium]
MFKVGEYVVYGMNGVCKVEEIGPMNLSGIDNDKDYYTLLPLYTKGSRVYTPVDNQKVVIRPVISKTDACSLIDEMRDVELIEVKDDKHRELAYKESLKLCNCRELVRIINTIQKRKEERLAQGKKMSACDERYLKTAQDGLYGEFAISLKIEKDEVEEYIAHRLTLKDMASAS